MSVSDEADVSVRRHGWIWRPAAWYLGPVTVIVAAISLFGRPEFTLSAVWAVDAALTSIYVLWPIALGASAVPVIRLRRTASFSLLEALPTGAQWRALVMSAAWPGIWICAGLLAGTVLALGVAAWNGSPPNWRAIAPVAPALTGTMAMSALGGACAARVPGWLVPPVLTVAGFACLVFDVGGARVLTDWVGATGSVIVAMHLRPGVLLGLCAAFAALVVAGLAISGALTTGLRRWWAVGVTAGVAAVLILAGADLRAPRMWADDSTWPCTPVPATDTEVCLPSDQRAMTDAVSQALSPTAARLAELDPAMSTARFSPSAAMVDAGGARRTVWITLPIGRPGDATRELVPAVTDGLAVCWGPNATAAEDAQMAREMVVLQWWLAPELVPDTGVLEAYGIAERAPTREEAGRAYSVLTECDR
ncbi:hypothetical protein [Georgenia sp. 1P01AC]|uniref:hypothetical protein n=1 Tax=Georgenia sp. 1P01AC TaxID=554103 RepID=UPI0039B03384